MEGQNIEIRYTHDDEGYNNAPTIIKTVGEIQFVHLQEISLAGNQIESVERLNRVRMLKVAVFDLSKVKTT